MSKKFTRARQGFCHGCTDDVKQSIRLSVPESVSSIFCHGCTDDVK
ncbi:MAG: hypothetical protein F6K48_04210 [Okeania sp. SIO3H1]|nr:hypothetical protein [Okeania sp. SIO3H1]